MLCSVTESPGSSDSTPGPPGSWRPAALLALFLPVGPFAARPAAVAPARMRRSAMRDKHDSGKQRDADQS